MKKENNKIIDTTTLIVNKLDIDAFITGLDNICDALEMSLKEYIEHMFRGLPKVRKGFKLAIDKKIKKYQEVKKLLNKIED